MEGPEHSTFHHISCIAGPSVDEEVMAGPGNYHIHPVASYGELTCEAVCIHWSGSVPFVFVPPPPGPQMYLTECL